MTLIGAKDEREAIGVMYQALSLIEVYFNRTIQHLLMSCYNIDKTDADKPINEYFESEFFIVNELLQNYKSIALKSKKEDKKSDNSSGVNAEHSKKYKELQGEYDSLRGRFDKLLKKCETLEKSSSGDRKSSYEVDELKITIAELQAKLNKEHSLKEQVKR